MNITVNGILEYDRQAGLKISSRAEILEDLKAITKIAYGEDFVIEQGNEWFSFLDLLAGSLSNVAGASQELYNSLSFEGASGTTLDNAVAFAGIKRRPYSNSTVVIVASVDTSVERPLRINSGLVLVDSNGGKWISKEDIVIEKYKKSSNGIKVENYVGTALFEASSSNTDPTGIQLAPYNNNTNDTLEPENKSYEDHFTFINETPSIVGHLEESDAQLRSRFVEQQFRQSTGTYEGLKAQLLDIPQVGFVNIIENPSAESSGAPYNLPAHSIWCIVDGVSTWDGSDYSRDVNDINIANTILNHKSLGCVVSSGSDESYSSGEGTGQIKVKLTRDSSEYEIKFSRATLIETFVDIKLNTELTDLGLKNSIIEDIKLNVENYVNNLGIGNDVLTSGVAACINNVITQSNFKDYVFDIDSIGIDDSADPTEKRLSVDVNRYAMISPENITVSYV